MKHSVYLIQCPPFWLKTAPLNLAYLQSYLTHKNFKTQSCDLNLEIFKKLNVPVNQWLSLNKPFEDGLFELIEKNHPQILTDLYKAITDYTIIGFSVFKRNATFTFNLAQSIQTKFPNKKIVFGGPQTLFQKHLDNSFWVVGEGEIPLYSIATGQTQNKYEFCEIDDLDNLPFLNFNNLDPKFYSSYIPLFSSRGCPHQCNFCSERLLYKKLRWHSPTYMVDQIKFLINKHNCTNFVFCDSMINFSNQWLTDFCSMLIRDNLNINWEAQIRVNKNFSLALAKRLKKSGCYNLFIGLESGSDKTLKRMNKGFTTEEAANFLRTLSQANLHFEISLITGYPEESEDEFNQTQKFIKTNKNFIAKIAQVNPFIDYLNDFPKKSYPTEEAKQRTEKLIALFQKEKIKYTKGFINNLIYPDYRVRHA